MGSGPVSFSKHDNIYTDIAEIRIQLQLTRTVNESSSVQDDVWAVGEDLSPSEAVQDLCQVFERHGNDFFKQFTDLRSAYNALVSEDESRLPDYRNKPFGEPILNLPGRGGSMTRLTHLAVVAARLGRRDEEVAHLEQLLEQSELGGARARLGKLRGTT